MKIVESSIDSDSIGQQICIKVRSSLDGVIPCSGFEQFHYDGLDGRNAAMHMPEALIWFPPVQADEYSAALVVMAAHNKGRLLKYLLGSATKYCVNHCRSTVLVHHM